MIQVHPFQIARNPLQSHGVLQMMEHNPQSQVELRDVARGLWIWRLEHPKWKPGQGWEPVVASTCVESGGQRLLLDPLAPPADATEVWERLDGNPPTLVVVFRAGARSGAGTFGR